MPSEGQTPSSLLRVSGLIVTPWRMRRLLITGLSWCLHHHKDDSHSPSASSLSPASRESQSRTDSIILSVLTCLSREHHFSLVTMMITRTEKCQDLITIQSAFVDDLYYAV